MQQRGFLNLVPGSELMAVIWRRGVRGRYIQLDQVWSEVIKGDKALSY